MSDEIKICYGCMRELKSDVCSCGWHYNYTREESITLLSPGTLLGHGQYRIGRKIGQGGFGITYLGAQQDRLGIRVAIKEYFPRRIVHRNICASNEVFPNNPPGMSPKEAQDISGRFERGKQAFIEEARRLAVFNELPSIVSVLGYVEENNTAYIVMEYIDGIDLQCHMRNLGRTLTFQEVRGYVFPIMKDLDQVHRSGIIHRDISPDNIMITHNGSAKLIDFGASVSQEEGEVKILRKNGFAPPEQYETSGERLGPWTDVYAFCATIFMLLTGQVPPDARTRQTQDELPTFRSMQLFLPGGLEKILRKGLALERGKRYQSMRELSKRLGRVRDYRKARHILGAAALCAAGLAVIGTSTAYLAEEKQLSGDEPPVREWSAGEEIYSGTQVDSTSDYAVFDGLVYIRYTFEDGLTMLARSPVGADDIAEVEYVTDGPVGNFCVCDNVLYFISAQEQCMYRMDLEEGGGAWVKISSNVIDSSYPFCVADGYIYSLLENEDGSHELQRTTLDGSVIESTRMRLRLLLCRFYRGHIYMTTKEEGETVLSRMRMDGTYYEELGRFQGDIPAMIMEEGTIYYLFNSDTQEQDSYVGSMEVNGVNNQKLARLSNRELRYCYMTSVVDNDHIYYTCSKGGTELLNNLYCYSISEGSNKQISSECGRYVATSDEVDYIIFASSDGSEIRQMNKDGSNPRVMREADGTTGIQKEVDITSLVIIHDHVYYLDGGNVAYKQIFKDEV